MDKPRPPQSPFAELVTTDVFALGNSELKAHIKELQFNKSNMLSSVQPSTNQLDQQIELAQHELAARSSSRLARVSIVVSTLAVAIAAIGVLIQAVGK